MMFFSERKKLAEEYEKWVSENKDIMDCPLSVISYLVMKGYLTDVKKQKPKAIKKTLYITTDLNDQAEELGINFSLVLREALKKEIKRLKDE